MKATNQQQIRSSHLFFFSNNRLSQREPNERQKRQTQKTKSIKNKKTRTHKPCRSLHKTQDY